MTGTSHPDNDQGRCPDCEHRWIDHGTEGCWFADCRCTEPAHLLARAAATLRDHQCPGATANDHGLKHCAECCYGAELLADTEEELNDLLLIRDLRDRVMALREEVDTLRADQALGQEGHQRVCVPLVAERDALRREIRHFIAEARQLAHQIKQPDTFCGNDAEVWRLLFLLGGDRP